MSQIVDLAWINHENVGDLSYKITMPLAFPNCDFEFTEKINETYANDKTYILGGGHICFTDFLKQLQKFDKKYALSVSVDGNSNFDLLNGFKKILVRDFLSIKHLEKHGLIGTYCPDFAFLLKPNPSNGKLILDKVLQNRDRYDQTIFCVINAHLLFETGTRLVRNELHFLKFSLDLAEILDNVKANVIFIPFSTNKLYHDNIAQYWINSKCKFYNKNIVMPNGLGVQDTLDLISACNLGISTRLHTSIFSTISGVPFIDITHHDKNKGFVNTINWNYSVNYWDYSKEIISEDIKDFMDAPTWAKDFLNKATELQREILNKEIANVGLSG
jgi:polysaccharide pyruvyl transferase WcaK-like protein